VAALVSEAALLAEFCLSVRLFILRSLCLLITNVHDSIEVPFRVVRRVNSRHHVLDGGPVPPTGRDSFFLGMGQH